MEAPGTREALISAARGRIVEAGLSGVSMRAVAAQCGVSATAIYRHFDDKDALVCAAVLDGFRRFGSYLLASLEAPSPLERLRCMTRRYFDFALEHPQHYRLIFMLDCHAVGMDKLDSSQKREVHGTFQMLRDRIAECQVEGVVREGDPSALAAYVWASLHGLASLLLTGNIDGSESRGAALVERQLTLTLQSLAPHDGRP